MRTTIALLALIGLAACDTLLGSHAGDAGLADPCNVAGGQANVAGVWTLRGSGSRHDCDRAQYNSDSVDVSSASGALVVTQDDAGVLQLASSAPGGFDFRGTVTGSCVEFTTSEGSLCYDFGSGGSATVDRPQHIAGRFEASGPGTCAMSGSFSVDIAAAAAP